MGGPSDPQLKERMFTFGCCEKGDVKCPSLTAFPPSISGFYALHGHVAAYDDLLMDKRGVAVGIVNEESARLTWLEILSDLLETRPDSELTKQHRLVAEKLGWIKSVEQGSEVIV